MGSSVCSDLCKGPNEQIHYPQASYPAARHVWIKSFDLWNVNDA